jgi:hypothetical protein
VLSQEKWELSAVNADLQQRLQQTVALAHMQVRGLVPEGDDRGPMLTCSNAFSRPSLWPTCR